MNAPVSTLDDVYPSSDGKPMAETGIHVLVMMYLLGMLKHRYQDREDVYVAANMFLYYAEGRPKKRRSPDIMFAKGVKGRHERRSFMTWVERVVPSCIIELTSKKTAKEDLKEKKPLYRRLGVREYFLFDPLDDYLPRQLMGFRLVAGKYKPIKADPDGSLRSKELGLRLCPEGYYLALYDSKTGERLLNMQEISERAAKLSDRAAAIQERFDEQRDILEKERRRNAELQAELARLKASQGKPSAQ